MSVESYLLILSHLVIWTLGMGVAFYFAFAAVPMVNKHMQGEERLVALRRHAKFYHITFLLTMSLMVVSGAIRLTDYKIVLGLQYFSDVSTVLIVKLLIFFIVYILAAYQSFGLALRITGTGEKAMDDKVPAELVDKVVGRMRTIAILNLFLMTAAAYVGLMLSRIPYFK
ncbi:MAG: hypothetical protein IT572_09585 [Deltaproteobacteria bacterium]|nr:hypothetical protein [Deltaproteobacteria bacterium]